MTHYDDTTPFCKCFVKGQQLYIPCYESLARRGLNFWQRIFSKTKNKKLEKKYCNYSPVIPRLDRGIQDILLTERSLDPAVKLRDNGKRERPVTKYYRFKGGHFFLPEELEREKRTPISDYRFIIKRHFIDPLGMYIRYQLMLQPENDACCYRLFDQLDNWQQILKWLRDYKDYIRPQQVVIVD